MPEANRGRALQAVAAARALLDQEGPDAVTMRRIAAQLGIQAPSLYKHVRDKADLEAAIIASGLVELATALEQALDQAPDQAQQPAQPQPLAALAGAYREFALAHPHLYRLMTDRPLPRDRLPVGVEQRAARPLLQAVGDPTRARAVWAFAHGMVVLELAQRFPPDADLDAAWRAGIRAFHAPSPSI